MLYDIICHITYVSLIYICCLRPRLYVLFDILYCLIKYVVEQYMLFDGMSLNKYVACVCQIRI